MVTRPREPAPTCRELRKTRLVCRAGLGRQRSYEPDSGRECFFRTWVGSWLVGGFGWVWFGLVGFGCLVGFRFGAVGLGWVQWVWAGCTWSLSDRPQAQ